jgi:hypothetical protein
MPSWQDMDGLETVSGLVNQLINILGPAEFRGILDAKDATELSRVGILRMQVLERFFPSSFLRLANLEGQTGLV